MSIALNQLLLRHTFIRSIHKAIGIAYSTSSKKSALDFNDIKHPTKVPPKPVITHTIKSEKINIDRDTIELLMRLSLVNLSDEYVNN